MKVWDIVTDDYKSERTYNSGAGHQRQGDRRRRQLRAGERQ
jgi:hypothetical protein